MILYTTMPQELIFQTPESDYGKQTVIEYREGFRCLSKWMKTMIIVLFR